MKTTIAKTFLPAAVLLAVAVFAGNIAAQAQTLTTIHSFPSNGSDGQEPYPQHLAFDSAGAVYGTTVTNGSPYWGTVFKLVPATIGGGSSKEKCSTTFREGIRPATERNPSRAWCSTQTATSTGRPLSAATPAPAAVGAA